MRQIPMDDGRFKEGVAAARSHLRAAVEAFEADNMQSLLDELLTASDDVGRLVGELERRLPPVEAGPERDYDEWPLHVLEAECDQRGIPPKPLLVAALLADDDRQAS